MTEDYATFVKDQGIVSVIKGVDTPDNVPQALLDSADSIKDSVGSMQSLAVANPDLYINLADMINGTKSPEDVASNAGSVRSTGQSSRCSGLLNINSGTRYLIDWAS